MEVGVVESDGKLGILKNSQFLPLTPGDLSRGGEATPSSGLAGEELIIDGKVMDGNVAAAGLTRQSLEEYLKSNGVKNISDVTLATLTPQGQLYVDLRQDRLGQPDGADK